MMHVPSGRSGKRRNGSFTEKSSSPYIANIGIACNEEETQGSFQSYGPNKPWSRRAEKMGAVGAGKDIALGGGCEAREGFLLNIVRRLIPEIK